MAISAVQTCLRTALLLMPTNVWGWMQDCWDRNHEGALEITCVNIRIGIFDPTENLSQNIGGALFRIRSERTVRSVAGRSASA